MPNRILREGILTSERVEQLDFAEEVFYRRLMSIVDDYGRYYARPGLIRAACYPLLLEKVSDSDVEYWLNACENARLVQLYRASDGKFYLQMLDFKQQVRVDKSKFPHPDDLWLSDDKHMLCGCQADEHLDVVEGVDVVEGETTHAVSRPANGLPECPHKAILDLYHEVLPENPVIRKWTPARQATLRSCWKTEAKEKGWKSEAEGLDYFRKYFGFVSGSRFLTGKTPSRAPGQPPFVADLEWLIKPANYAKIIEGKYT